MVSNHDYTIKFVFVTFSHILLSECWFFNIILIVYFHPSKSQQHWFTLVLILRVKQMGFMDTEWRICDINLFLYFQSWVSKPGFTHWVNKYVTGLDPQHRCMIFVMWVWTRILSLLNLEILDWYLNHFLFHCVPWERTKGMESLKQYVWDYLIEKSYELLKSQSI